MRTCGHTVVTATVAPCSLVQTKTTKPHVPQEKVTIELPQEEVMMELQQEEVMMELQQEEVPAQGSTNY